MKNLMKKGVMQFVLLCLVAFSQVAAADVRSMFYNDGLTEITYDWNALDDEITNLQYSIVNPNITSLTLVDPTVFPATLGNISFDADGTQGDAEIDFKLSDVVEDLSTGLFTHFYDLEIFFVDTQISQYSDVAFTEVSAVPVPAALPLMASALGLFGIARRRRA